jgi:signal transduction histidine kinase
VWQNLLENAIKFSSVNSAKSIEVGCVFDDKELVYYVKDNGVGFAAEQAEEIFVPFKRLNNHESAEGSGIGLAISKKIILNHGGRIWAESKPDIGSTFYFSLPAMNEENNDQ